MGWESRRWESNPQPVLYESTALPLSHVGKPLSDKALRSKTAVGSHFWTPILTTDTRLSRLAYTTADTVGHDPIFEQERSHEHHNIDNWGQRQ